MNSEDFIEKLNRIFFGDVTRKYKVIAKVFFFIGLAGLAIGSVLFLLALIFYSEDALLLSLCLLGTGGALVPSCWLLYGRADLLDNVHHIRLEMTRGFLSNERSTSIDQLPRL